MILITIVNRIYTPPTITGGPHIVGVPMDFGETTSVQTVAGPPRPGNAAADSHGLPVAGAPFGSYLGMSENGVYPQL